MKPDEETLSIRRGEDIVVARLAARRIAEEIGFSRTDVTIIVTVVSEVARNIIRCAKGGEIHLFPVCDGGRKGLGILGRDNRQGVSDAALAARESYPRSGGRGLGLPGIERMMDACEIAAENDWGTTIVLKKWLREEQPCLSGGG